MTSRSLPRILMVGWMLLAASDVFAQSKSGGKEGANYPHGVQAEVSIGTGSAMIANPDSTTAYYSATALEGRGHIPLFNRRWMSFELIGNIRYLDLTNTAEASGQKEVANLIGPGLGLQLRFFPFVVGFQTEYLFARHYAVGSTSRELEYSMTVAKTYYGLIFPFQNLAVGLTASSSTGSIPSDRTGLSAPCPYSDQVYWLSFTYSTGASFVDFLKYLF